MVAVLRIVDKQLGQAAGEAFELRLASERLTARELIGRRIAEEVRLINEKRFETSKAHDKARSFLVRFETNPTERKLNIAKPVKRPAALNEADELAAAIEGFQSNAFVMLFDDRQVEDLDDEVTVTGESELVFLRMVPLIGG